MKSVSGRLARMVAGVSAIAVWASSGSAQSARTISFGIAGGVAIPVGSLADNYTTGYTGAAVLSLKSAGSPVGVRLDLMDSKMKVKGDRIIAFPGGGEVDATSISSLTANLVYSPRRVGVSPYLIGGGGLYGIRLHTTGLVVENESDNINKFGVNGGAGAAFPIGRLTAYIEARLHHVFTDESATQFVPITFGLSIWERTTGGKK